MTMIEVMVAVAILAVMGFLTYGSLVITIRSQQRADVLQERYHAARVFLGRFKREVSMAFLSLHQAEDKRTETLFDGARDRLTFNTSAYEPIRRDAHESDELEVEYRLDRDEEGQPAVVRRVKLHIDERGGKGGREEVVLQGVKELEFEYYNEEGQDWESEWEVTIDDAVEKREMLKTIKLARDAAEALRTDDTGGIGQRIGNQVAAEAYDKVAEKSEQDVMERITLPSRIRVKLVLEDETGREYPLETQVELRVTDPLWY
ncbi:MAG: prepilin-type N-terminal cleavage/methylation domain-containing protein [Deltaproteobacteria bacterium]|nr:prepilin-type N-terminal cleavage/methylation domain-containing protein [Deltaproteobacteria bacterium]MCB9785182.1 prepilin-type N-terminal cleavage/methylation domain-containing protein [Deltaproteobacteria bacterium]